eukprot:TRINITY_DN9138_c0_g1_i1.p2 TRINITY_DN9138_c0_g1~~TRINITY_DN9138_c0_g1_i1.p2  ORF type:complete len:113 (+),score=21.63 TRINITY_DN9138_c0_g1_i1:155-493(+)
MRSPSTATVRSEHAETAPAGCKRQLRPMHRCTAMRSLWGARAAEAMLGRCGSALRVRGHGSSAQATVRALALALSSGTHTSDAQLLAWFGHVTEKCNGFCHSGNAKTSSVSP